MSDRFFETNEPLLESVIAWSYQRIVEGQDRTTTARPRADLRAELKGSVRGEGIGGEEALRLFTDVIVTATRAQDDPMNLAYVPAAPTPASLTFDLAVSAAEIFAGVWEVGAGAIAAENQALAWLSELAGYPADAGGTFVQGGTIGNLSALATAREKARHIGGEKHRPWAIAASGGAHSSIRSAALVLDVEVIDVPSDSRDRMTGEVLEAALADHPDLAPFAVVATGGTTNSGSIDDLDDIADVCERNQLWMHVDGAYGLAGLAAPSVRPKFNGIERSNSFIVDPHKWLFAPYDCCALIYRDPGWAPAAHAQHAEYLDELDRSEWNPSEYAIQLTRRARGLPFWFSLATYGTRKYGEAVERGIETAREIAAQVEETEHLTLLLEPDLSVVLFRRDGWSDDQMQAWSNEKKVTGEILIIPTRWKGESVFRLCVVSPDTKASEVMDSLASMSEPSMRDAS